MAFNPDDKIQWENLAPTLQALLEDKMEEHSRNYFNSHINKYVNIAISSSNSYTDSKVSYLQSLIESNTRAISGLSSRCDGLDGKITGIGSGGGTGSGGGGGNPPSGGGGKDGKDGKDGNLIQEKTTSAKFTIGIIQCWTAPGLDSWRTSGNVDAIVYDTIYTYTTGSYGKTLIGQSDKTISRATLSLGALFKSIGNLNECMNPAKSYVEAHINDFKSRIAHGTEATKTSVHTEVTEYSKYNMYDW